MATGHYLLYNNAYIYPWCLTGYMYHTLLATGRSPLNVIACSILVVQGTMVDLTAFREPLHPGINNTADLPAPKRFKPLFDILWRQDGLNVVRGIANDLMGAEDTKPHIIWSAIERIQESVNATVQEQSKPYSGFFNPRVEEETCKVCGSSELIVDRLKGDVICSKHGCGEIQTDLSENIYHGNMYRDPEKTHWAPLSNGTVIENFNPQSSNGVEIFTGASAATKEIQCTAVRKKMSDTGERYAIPKKVVDEAAAFFDCHRHKLSVLRANELHAAACLIYAVVQDRYNLGSFPSWRCMLCPFDKRPRFVTERDINQHIIDNHGAAR